MARPWAWTISIGTPAILKTRRMGYDGKGQRVFRNAGAGDCAGVYAAMGSVPLILEGFIPFVAEISVIAARVQDGAVAVYDPSLNVHRDGILHTSTVPCGVAPDAVERARAAAGSILSALGYVGVLTCEFFATANGPVFNEMAPRVHNSGHWTIEGAVTSQFENHIRAVAGLPLGDTFSTAERVVMENLIGDVALRTDRHLADPRAHLHLYGKAEARDGRKMGHITRVG